MVWLYLTMDFYVLEPTLLITSQRSCLISNIVLNHVLVCTSCLLFLAINAAHNLWIL